MYAHNFHKNQKLNVLFWAGTILPRAGRPRRPVSPCICRKPEIEELPEIKKTGAAELCCIASYGTVSVAIHLSSNNLCSTKTNGLKTDDRRLSSADVVERWRPTVYMDGYHERSVLYLFNPRPSFSSNLWPK